MRLTSSAKAGFRALVISLKLVFRTAILLSFGASFGFFATTFRWAAVSPGGKSNSGGARRFREEVERVLEATPLEEVVAAGGVERGSTTLEEVVVAGGAERGGSTTPEEVAGAGGAEIGGSTTLEEVVGAGGSARGGSATREEVLGAGGLARGGAVGADRPPRRVFIVKGGGGADLRAIARQDVC